MEQQEQMQQRMQGKLKELDADLQAFMQNSRLSGKCNNMSSLDLYNSWTMHKVAAMQITLEDIIGVINHHMMQDQAMMDKQDKEEGVQ